MQEVLNKITHTIEGYEVKNLTWKPIDNIIVGLVRCPIWGNENLHDGFVSCKWNKKGFNLKDSYRKDLNLNIGIVI